MPQSVRAEILSREKTRRDARRRPRNVLLKRVSKPVLTTSPTPVVIIQPVTLSAHSGVFTLSAESGVATPSTASDE